MSKTTSIERLIRAAGDDLHERLSADPPVGIESTIDRWIEQRGLARLDEPRRILGRQAAICLLLKAVSYEHERARGADLPEIDAHRIRHQFRVARETTGDPTFEGFLLDDVAEAIDIDHREDLLEASARLLGSGEPAEAIGRLFEHLTPQESRRKLGQFRTPPEVAGLMADWCVRDSRDHVLDPGVGAGALSVAGYRRKRALDPNATLSEIHGVDLDELALVMAATSLRLLDHSTTPDLRTGDFLALDPSDIEDVDAVIANPPYTRHHELDDTTKERINQQATEETGSELSSLSSLYAYFYIHATRFIEPGDRMAFITPAEFLETNYGSDLKRYLLDNFDIQALVMAERGTSLFEEAMTTSCISFLERQASDDDPSVTKFIHLERWPGRDAICDAIEDGQKGKTSWGYVNPVQQETLDPEEKWTLLFSPLDIEHAPALEPLSNIASVQRGIATGSNDYFCLTQADVNEWELDEEYLTPIVRNASKVTALDYTETDWEHQRAAGEQAWLLYSVDGWKPELDRTNIRQYLDHGREIDADESYLARHRTPWYTVDRRAPPDILFRYMSRSDGRFVYNRAGVRNLNNLHGVTLHDVYTDTDVRALLAYLNSRRGNLVVQRAGREYMGGLSKLEPNELEGIPVLDPHALSDEDKETLARLFDALCEACRCGEPGEVMDTIDTELDKLLDE
jgi:adenine-specific DNA methylase